MTEERPEKSEFEREDLSPTGILGFLLGLALTGLLIHLILAGMYQYLDGYDKAHQPPPNPLVHAQIDMRQPTSQEANQFPLPRLETNERGQLRDSRLEEEKILNTYGWVDQKKQVLHIPIARAMELVAQRGLPVAPQNWAAPAGTQMEKSAAPRRAVKPAPAGARQGKPERK